MARRRIVFYTNAAATAADPYCPRFIKYLITHTHIFLSPSHGVTAYILFILFRFFLSLLQKFSHVVVPQHPQVGACCALVLCYGARMEENRVGKTKELVAVKKKKNAVRSII